MFADLFEEDLGLIFVLVIGLRVFARLIVSLGVPHAGQGLIISSITRVRYLLPGCLVPLLGFLGRPPGVCN